jgi:hypothetical protein
MSVLSPSPVTCPPSKDTRKFLCPSHIGNDKLFCLQDPIALPTSIWYGNGRHRFESIPDRTTRLDHLKHMNTQWSNLEAND